MKIRKHKKLHMNFAYKNSLLISWDPKMSTKKLHFTLLSEEIGLISIVFQRQF
jgi:hypothetical protein